MSVTGENRMSEVSSTSLRDVIRPGSKRGLDFVIIDELRKRTGINPNGIVKFAVAETLFNSLDKGSTHILITLRREDAFDVLQVSDNGSKKLTLAEVKLILDFDLKASSKRGHLRVSRGYLGNALKCIFGYSYALAESKGLGSPEIVVVSGCNEYHICLKPNLIKQVIESEVSTVPRQDNGYTTFILKFPKSESTETQTIKDLIFATSMVNPNRKISFNLFDFDLGTLGSESGEHEVRSETSILWYDEKQFLNLYEDFLRVKPETQLKQFIALFRGFTAKKVIREILQNLGSQNHDSGANGDVQFFPTTPMSGLVKPIMSKLFRELKARGKPIAKRSVPSVLGCVGEKAFEQLRTERQWQKLRYIQLSETKHECPEWYNHGPLESCKNPNHVQFPVLIELAVFDRNDGEGLKVYSCVNFMASMEPIFSRVFDISYRLGLVGIKSDTSVTVAVHLVSPVLKWLNYGKSGLDE